MKLSKYDFADLVAIIIGSKTLEEVAEKYGVDVKTIQRECNRRGIHLVKKQVRATRKYKYVTESTEYDSVYQCAEAFGVDSSTIKRAIEGEHIKKLGRWKFEYIQKEEYYDEQTGERYIVERC